METYNPALFDRRIANWKDLCDFEFVRVMRSNEAAERIGPRL